MKKHFIYFFAILVMMTKAYSSCPQSLSSCEKTYVNKEQIVFDDDHIFIQFPTQFLEVNAVQRDGNGLYFDHYYKQGDCEDGYWECQVCHACTRVWYLFCSVCWEPR